MVYNSRSAIYVQLSELHQIRVREILTVIELLDAVLFDPIILLTRTEERNWWDLEPCLY